MVTINLEGVDKVGKHTTTISCIKVLLHDHHKVVMLDAPQYWFFGSVLRKALNTEHFDTNGKREIELRCVLYTIDRLFSFIILSPYLKSHPKCIVVADRGWASNAVTLGYGVAQKKIDEKDIQKYVDNLQKWEQEYIELLNPISILLTTGVGGKSAMEKGIMKCEDFYEQPEPQIHALRVYRDFLKLKEVVTQHNSEWRNAVDIAQDILSAANVSVKSSTYDDLDKMKTIDVVLNKNLFIVGPKNFLPIFYGDEWSEKRELFSTMLDEHDIATIDGNKDLLKNLENNISSLVFLHLPQKCYFDVPEIVVSSLKRNFKEFPEIADIILASCGEHFLKFIQENLIR